MGDHGLEMMYMFKDESARYLVGFNLQLKLDTGRSTGKVCPGAFEVASGLIGEKPDRRFARSRSDARKPLSSCLIAWSYNFKEDLRAHTGPEI